MPARRGKAIASGAVAGGAAAAAALVRRLYRGPVPRHDGTLRAPRLETSCEIVRDVHGVPHIRAGSFADAVYGLGLCHAQDRLWQLEILRRVTRGTVSELVGKAGLASDRYVRVLGLARVADAASAAASGEGRRLADAYCTGVSAYLDSRAFRVPLELRLLARRRVAPWTVADCHLPALFFALYLGQNFEGEIVRARLAERLGAERLAELEGRPPADGYTSLPRGAAEAALSAARARAAAGGSESAGSNSWAVDAAHSATGGALLANDPHLVLGLPSVWYVADLAWPGGRVAGFTLPGMPMVVIGRTEGVAWGLTAAMADTQDLFAVDLATTAHDTRVEEIRLRGRRAPSRLEVVVTQHGPVVTPLVPGESRALALRWTALEQIPSLDGAARIAHAQTGEELVAAFAAFPGPPLNLVWAARDGSVGYKLVGGPMPLRGRGDGSVPQDGADPAAHWRGTIPYDELPEWRDPGRGFIVTANNRIVGDDYPYFLSHEWLNPYRAERIDELLSQDAPIDIARCLQIQLDLRSLPGLKLRELARRHLAEPATDVERRALALLLAWDGELVAASGGGAVYGVLLRQLCYEVFAEAGDELEMFLGSEGFTTISSTLAFYRRAVPHLLELAERADDAFFADGRTWRGVFAKCLTRTATELEARLGADVAAWRWGDAHRLVLDHPLAALPGLRGILRRGPFPLGGDDDTVWQARHPPGSPESGVQTTGPSMRFATDLADPDATRFVLCGGQSGHPASPAYDDQVTDWLLGRARPLAWSDAAIERARAAVLVLEPAG